MNTLRTKTSAPKAGQATATASDAPEAPQAAPQSDKPTGLRQPEMGQKTVATPFAIDDKVVATLHQIAKAVSDSCTDWLTEASRINALKDAYSLIETLPEEIREPIRSIASTSETLMHQEEIDFDAEIDPDADIEGEGGE